MADLRLITILPPQSVSGVQPTQVTGNPTPQGALSSFQPGSILSGFIINRDSGGNPILRTDSGDITFASNFFLKIGSEITIRIEHIAGGNSAHILTVNGQPPEIAVLQSGFVQEPEFTISENLRPSVQPNTSSQSGVTSAATAQSTPTPTITVTGTVISPGAVQSAVPDNQSPALPNGSQLSLKIVKLLPPPLLSAPAVNTNNITATQSSNQPQTPQAQLPNTYAAYARISAATPAVPATPAPVIMPQGSIPHNSPQNTTSPTLPTPQNPTPQNTQSTPSPLLPNVPPQVGQQVNATVINNDPNGEAIIQTPVGIIRLQAGTQLPIGSHVIFEISQVKTPDELVTDISHIATGNIAATTPAPLTQLARSPGALSNIFTLLSGIITPDALDFINRNIPSVGQPPPGIANPNAENQQPQHNLISSLFSYAAALKNGDFREWLGRGNAKWLEDNGHENLLKKAEGEFASLSRQLVDTPQRQWQAMFFPIAVAGELQQARLFVKRDRKQKENEGSYSAEEDTRFVVEMDLTQLGEMQMDGFVRNNNNNIQFDLVIRSYTQLSQEIQKDILGIYNSMGELTGYTGSLAFQAVKDFPVNPMEDIISDDHEGIVA